MFTIAKGFRLLFAIVALAFLAGPVSANAPPPDRSPRTTTTQRTHNTGRAPDGAQAEEQAPPAGSPEFGVLILIGIVAFLVVIAWVIARFGDNTRPPSDSVMS